MKKLTQIWYYFFDEFDSFDKEFLFANLKNFEFELSELDPDQCEGIGIIFFKNTNPPIINFINQMCYKSINRILAVGNIPSNLSDDFTWNLIQSGASDIILYEKSDDCINKIVARIKRWVTIEEVIKSPYFRDNIIGNSRIWNYTIRQVIDIAHFSNSSILITGESGTGKELIANLIHSVDSRQDKKEFVILDCTTIVPELAGSEFFGHVRGAFTGAITSRDGAFELSNNGTLFLDEIGDLPLNLQAQLLRVIQEHTYKQVGGNSWHSTEFRLICATNKDLKEEVQKGLFRTDLYYRIAQWTIKLPSLHDRKEDILLLAKFFCEQLIKNKSKPKIDSTVCEYLLTRKYPGNIRDLKQTIARIMHNYVGNGPITIGDIPFEDLSIDSSLLIWPDEQFIENMKRGFSLGLSLREIRNKVEDTLIKIALGESNGRVKEAAKRLGISDRALQMKRATSRGNNIISELNIKK